jgi:hypothetical protein
MISGCQNSEPPGEESTQTGEQPIYSGMVANLCGSIDLGSLSSLGEKELVSDTSEAKTSHLGYAPLLDGCYVDFITGDTYSRLIVDFTIGGSHATIADQMAEIQLDPWGIYPHNGPEFTDRYVPEEELPQADTQDLEFEGWDAATLVNIVELSDDLNTWDPDGRGIRFFVLFQHDNLVIQLELQKKALGEDKRPGIEPYVETLTNLAGQMRDRIAEASA